MKDGVVGDGSGILGGVRGKFGFCGGNIDVVEEVER